MGFHVRLAERDSDFVRALRHTPSAAFPRGYAGYLLFLVGGAHPDALDWLKNNITNLDAATGRQIAFAVFARKVPLELKTDNSASNGMQPRVVGEVYTKDLSSIQRICKRGSLGWVHDGDLVEASTYAVDDVASELGVSNRLPCVVVIDAVPVHDALVIALDANVRVRFADTIRAAVAELESNTTYDAYRRKLDEIRALEEEAATLVAELSTIDRTATQFPDDSRILEIAESALAAIEYDLRVGISRRFLEHLKSIDELQLIAIDGIAAGMPSRIAHLVKTESTLIYYLKLHWPLDPSEEGRLADVFRCHVHRLIPELETPSGPLAISDIQAALNGIRAALHLAISEAMASLRMGGGVGQRCVAVMAERRAVLAKQREQCENRLHAALRQRDCIEQECSTETSPSLTAILKREIRSSRWRSFVIEIRDAVRAWLRLAVNETVAPKRLLEPKKP